LVTVTQAAEIIQTSRDTVIRLCNSGELPFEQVRSVSPRRIRLDHLIAYAERNGITLILPESEQK